MALNFPPNPTSGDTFTSGSLVYVFDGVKWISETTVAIQNSFANANAAFDRANLANSTANTALIVGSSAFDRANSANNLPVQKTGVLIGTRNRLNFLDGSGATITITDDAAGDRVNVSISASGGGGGGGEITTFDRVSSDFTMSSANQAVISIATTPITITLPDALTIKSYFFQNSGSNTMTLQTINSQMINNEQSLILAFNGSSCRLVSNGSAYLIF